MKKPMADKIVLSYNDVVLRQSDLDILNSRDYLNDQIIEFYFSYLTSCFPSSDISLIPPSIAFWIMNCPFPLKDFLEPLKLSEKKLVIFPINNNNDVEQAEGGTHWSLLAFEKNANVFVHHDSCGGMNAAHARRLYEAVVGFLCTSSSPSRVQYLECENSPQQANGYDCGLYVTAIARTICHWHCDNQSRDGVWFSHVKEQVTSTAVTQMRSEILALIISMMHRDQA